MVQLVTLLVSGLLAATAYSVPMNTGPIHARNVDNLNSLEIRATEIFCKPIVSGTKKTETYKISLDRASRSAKGAGFASGKSSYPHHYGNGEKIKWDVGACDKPSAILMEYPIHADTVGGKKDGREWQKERKVTEQPKTPIRAVFANVNGGYVFCGIMMHVEVRKSDNAGLKGFARCK